jgi:hypothetical protein
VNAAFADTSFYLALLDEQDSSHRRAIAEARYDRPVVTTEFVLLELADSCARGEDRADFLALLAGIRVNPRVRIVPLSSELLQRGVGHFRRHADKDWSLTDCISFVVMKGEGIHEALTADHHFEQAGFQALLK